MSDIFSLCMNLVLTRSFYSWIINIMTKKQRINFINGAFQYFLDILLSEKYVTDTDDFRGIIITEEMYPEFVIIFDKLLFHMRSEDKNDLPGDLWHRINELWNAIFYFRLYLADFKNPPINTYPNDNLILHDRFVEMKKLLTKNQILYEMDMLLEINDKPKVPEYAELESQMKMNDIQKENLSILNEKLNVIVKEFHTQKCQNEIRNNCAQF